MDAFGRKPKYAAFQEISTGSISKHVSGPVTKNDDGPGADLGQLSDLSKRITELELRFDKISGAFQKQTPHETPAILDLEMQMKRLGRGLPAGSSVGSILFWDGTIWKSTGTPPIWSRSSGTGFKAIRWFLMVAPRSTYLIYDSTKEDHRWPVSPDSTNTKNMNMWIYSPFLNVNGNSYPPDELSAQYSYARAPIVAIDGDFIGIGETIRPTDLENLHPSANLDKNGDFKNDSRFAYFSPRSDDYKYNIKKISGLTDADLYHDSVLFDDSV